MKAIKDHQTRCNMCEKPLNIDSAKMVEFSNTDGEYYRDGVPEGHESLGWFMVGPDCYKKALKSGQKATASDDLNKG